MHKVINSIVIVVVVAVLFSCEYWNKDMLGYLEYWSSNTIVGRIIVTPTPENVGGKQIIQPGTPAKVELHLMNGKSVPTTVRLPSQTWSVASRTSSQGTSFTNKHENAINTAILNLGTPKNGESLALNFELVASDGTRAFPSYSWGTIVCDARPEKPTDMRVDSSKNPVEATWRANVAGDHDDVNAMMVKWSRKDGTVLTDTLTKTGGNWLLDDGTSRLTVATATSTFTLQAPDALSHGTVNGAFGLEVTLFDKNGQTSTADLNSSLNTTSTVSFVDEGAGDTEGTIKVKLSAPNATTIWYKIGDNGNWTENTGGSVTLEMTGGSIVKAKAQETGKVTSAETQHRASVVVTFHSNYDSSVTSKQLFSYNVAGNLQTHSLTRTNYRFLGWSENDKANTATYTNGQSITLTQNKNLYAVWELVKSDSADEAVSRISSLTGEGPHQIKVTGAVSNEQLEKIRDAIFELTKQTPSPQVKLDLSGAIFDGNKLPNQAFYSSYPNFCTNLIEVKLPNTLTSLGQYSFYGTGISSIELPATMTSLAYFAFGQCENLTSISIPANITTLDSYIFRDCSKLATVTFEGSPTTIPIGMFQNCAALKKLTIPNTVTSIGIDAFLSSGLETIIIPAGVKDIGHTAFRSCNSLQTVTVESSSPPKMELYSHSNPPRYIFDNSNNLTSIFVPNSALPAYQSDSQWSFYKDKIKTKTN